MILLPWPIPISAVSRDGNFTLFRQVRLPYVM